MYEPNAGPKDDLTLIFGLAQYKFFPFNTKPRTSTKWISMDLICDPGYSNNSLKYKILLMEGRNPETAPTFSYHGTSIPRTCQFGDMIVNAQKNNAAGALVIMQETSTLTQLDKLDYANTNISEFATPSNRPNIPAGLIVYSYWPKLRQYKNNDNVEIEFGCSKTFGQPQCISVDFPNVNPEIHCG